MPYAHTGKLLWVDLDSEQWQVTEVAPDQVRHYLLGSGLAAKILLDRLQPQLDPLDPANPLLMVNGLLTGTFALTASRVSVCGRSPLTGIWCESVAGGYWGPELRFAGYDGVAFTGRAEKPVYLWIHDGQVELRPASSLWGLDSQETAQRVRDATDPKALVACVGPAAENGVLIAGVMFLGNGARTAGRGGMGALMASKNLKAVAVKGSQRPEYYDREGLRSSVREDTAWIKENSVGLSEFGTAGGVPATEVFGDLPIKNWLLGSWEEGANKTSGQTIVATMLDKHYRCFACPIACGKEIKITEGPYAGLEGHGPEYETLAAFGALLLNDDLQAIVKADQLCNRYGLDTISTGAVVALAMEAYEKGLLTAEDTGGLELEWGNAEAILQLVEQIARRQGLGDVLADGVKAAAERLGPQAEEMAIHAKGLALAMHDPRAFVDMAVNYATANRGGCHLEALSYWRGYGLEWEEWGQAGEHDRLDSAGKARVAYDFQNYLSVYNALGLCKFIIKGLVGPETVVEWLNLALGWDWDTDDLIRAGERLFNLKRMINLRLGVTRADDTLPRRLLTHARPSGSAAGVLPDLETMLEEYYQLRGWTAEGIPTDEKLRGLGLNDLG
ncbi:MAG: aldehyde ferredoxin oxidoreductase family protein [Anaerolineae bacterium]|nr:aldehyde ferredoxin oxidoreductase family protein [Anaerolineae bacterium]